MTRIAAFDVDGTITSRDCVVPFLRQVAGTPRLVAGLLRHPVDLATNAVQRNRDALKASSARATFAGRSEPSVRDVAGEFARHVHASWLRDDVVADLRRHQDAGDVTVLVSASFELYLEPLAELLGVDQVLATRLEVAGGVLTGRLDGPNCRAAEKVVRLHRWLDDAYGGRAAVHLTAYGDSPGDRELLADADDARWVGTRAQAG